VGGRKSKRRGRGNTQKETERDLHGGDRMPRAVEKRKGVWGEERLGGTHRKQHCRRAGNRREAGWRQASQHEVGKGGTAGGTTQWPGVRESERTKNKARGVAEK